VLGRLRLCSTLSEARTPSRIKSPPSIFRIPSDCMLPDRE
jgi:hypothetical protein